MPIPSLNHHGVIPPYTGANGPGGRPADLSPFAVSSYDVAVTLGTSPVRLGILDGWLRHRSELKALGMTGFQWIDGSFVEAKDQPADMDLVSFIMPPPAVVQQGMIAVNAMVSSNKHLFDRAAVRSAYSLDVLTVPLYSDPAFIVAATSYYLGLFSHRRQDNMWKGMLEVQINDATEAQARAFVTAPVSQGSP